MPKGVMLAVFFYSAFFLPRSVFTIPSPSCFFFSWRSHTSLLAALVWDDVIPSYFLRFHNTKAIARTQLLLITGVKNKQIFAA